MTTFTHLKNEHHFLHCELTIWFKSMCLTIRASFPTLVRHLRLRFRRVMPFLERTNIFLMMEKNKLF